MKIYEVKNGQHTTNEVLDIPFNVDFLNFKAVDNSFPDYIMIGYNDKTLLEELPYYPIESTTFSIETMGDNPEIKLNVFYEADGFGEKDMETLEVVFNESEKNETQTILLKITCDLLYGVPMFLKDKLKPSQEDIEEVRNYLNDFNINAEIPEFDTVGELWHWRSEQYRKSMAV
ncbi:hypothetical protein [uncultured Oscillibacter sp.]|uniref:hypothetical protein n=1 Tax=uncultured Oscillibacter sp. TaxID=876091 RepID=UPI0025F3821F|nr:hypothetical protein [uncultured Oscillibacter sp.]